MTTVHKIQHHGEFFEVHVFGLHNFSIRAIYSEDNSTLPVSFGDFEFYGFLKVHYLRDSVRYGYLDQKGPALVGYIPLPNKSYHNVEKIDDERTSSIKIKLFMLASKWAKENSRVFKDTEIQNLNDQIMTCQVNISYSIQNLSRYDSELTSLKVQRAELLKDLGETP